MARRHTDVFYACENDHAVARRSTLCFECGAPVTDRRIVVPRDRDEAKPASRPARPSLRLLTAAAFALSLLIAGIVIAVVVARTSETPGVVPPPPGSSSCEGIAQGEIGLNTEQAQAAAVTCFVVDVERVVIVGAESTANENLVLVVTSATGVFWGGADDSYGTDPEVASLFLPGTYVATVTTLGGGTPSSFVLYTVAEPPTPATTPGDPTFVPTFAQCGTEGIPLLEGPGSVSLGDERINVCLSLESAAFVKMGVLARPPGGADLALVLFRYDQAGEPEFYRSLNNTFGLDPEMSLDLEAGTYVIHVEEWASAPVGAFDVYVDTASEYFREGPVSAEFAWLRPADCASGAVATLDLGESIEIRGVTPPVACVTLAAPARLVFEANTLAGQDLTLEVVGFTEDGIPVRYGWADDYLWAEQFDDFDAKLDIALPAGTYAWAASTFGGDEASDVLLRVSRSTP